LSLISSSVRYATHFFKALASLGGFVKSLLSFYNRVWGTISESDVFFQQNLGAYAWCFLATVFWYKKSIALAIDCLIAYLIDWLMIGCYGVV
jgi:hypothetical protein